MAPQLRKTWRTRSSVSYAVTSSAAVNSSTTNGGKMKEGRARGSDGRFLPIIKDKKRGIEGQKKKKNNKKKKTEKKVSSGRPIVLQGNGKDREYEVERVLDQKRKKNGQVCLLIRWKGCPPSVDSWEPRDNVNPAALKDFEERRSREKSVNTAIVSPEDRRSSSRNRESKSGGVHGCTDSGHGSKSKDAFPTWVDDSEDDGPTSAPGRGSKIEDTFPTWVDYSEDDGPPSAGNSAREEYATPPVCPFFAGGSDYSDNDYGEREGIASHWTGWRDKEEEEEDLQYDDAYKVEDGSKREESRKATLFDGGIKAEAEYEVEDALGTTASRGEDVDCLEWDSEEEDAWEVEEDMDETRLERDDRRVLPTRSLPPRPRH